MSGRRSGCAWRPALVLALVAVVCCAAPGAVAADDDSATAAATAEASDDGGIIGDKIDAPFNLTEWLVRPNVLGNMVGLFITDEKNDPVFEVAEKLLYETQFKSADSTLAIGSLTADVGKVYMRRLPDAYAAPPNALVQFAFGALEAELTRSTVDAADALNVSTNGTGDFSALSRDERVGRALQYFQPLNVIVPVLHAYTTSWQPPPGVDWTCYADLKHAVHNLYQAEDWAINMFDSWGKLPAGVLYGNINWIGHYDQCLGVSAAKGVLAPGGTNISSTVGFNGSYCDVNFEIPESLNVPKAPGSDIFLLYGGCFPSTCGSEDVKLIVEDLSVFGLKLPKINSTRCHKEAPLQSGKMWRDPVAFGALFVTAVIVAVVIACTVVDGISLMEDSKTCTLQVAAATGRGAVNDGFLADTPQSSGPNDAESSFAVSPTDAKEAKVASSDAYPRPPPPLQNANGHTADGPHVSSSAAAAAAAMETANPGGSRSHTNRGSGMKLIKACSLYSTLPALMSTETRPSTLLGMDAVRYLSMCWIILGHCYSMGAAFVPSSMANVKGASTIIKDFAFQAIYSAPFAVDSFFCLSGTLVAYVFFKELTKAKGKLTVMSLVMFYVHRFIRILPLYAFMIFMMAVLGKYWGEGPLFDWNSNYITGCVKNWWTNLLFVNNFINSKEMCLSWTWYLSNDMQFHWISPFILIPLYYVPVAGSAILGVLFLGHFGITFYLWSLSDGKNYLNDPDVYYNAYIKPYCRIGPYFVGIILGVMLFKKYKLPQKSLALLYWFCAIFFIGLVIYIQYDENKEGKLENVWGWQKRCLFETFSRTAFAMSLAWTIYAVHNGYAGVIGNVMSWGGWQPLGRLTYAAFLVHPMLLFVFIGNRRDLFYLTNFTIAWIFCGYMVIAYAASMVLTLVVEMPFAGVEKTFYGLFGYKSAV